MTQPQVVCLIALTPFTVWALLKLAHFIVTLVEKKKPMNHAHFSRLIHTTRQELEAALTEYEATGDHNHGKGPIPPGGECPYTGHDCNVRRAREALKALE